MKIDISRVNLLEKDIEQYLWENPREVRFNGWVIDRWLKRQFIVPSGIIDLLGQTTFGWFVIVEIKNVEIDAKAVTQVLRYAYDINEILGRLSYGAEYRYNRFPTMILVGPSISTSTLRECESCAIQYIEFGANLTLSLSHMGLSASFKEERAKVYDDLAGDDLLREGHQLWQESKKESDERFRQFEESEEGQDDAESTEDQNGDLVSIDDLYSNIILNDGEEEAT